VRAKTALGRTLGRWRTHLALGYQRENYEVGPDSGLAVFTIPESEWRAVSADERLDPHRGLRVRLAARGGAEQVFSDVSFVQLDAQAKTIQSFGRQHRFIVRLDLGRVFTDRFRELPPSLRYFAGGAQSVRGYGYNSLGVRDAATNQVIGAPNLVVGSGEYEFRFMERWGAAVFYDAGGASRRFGGGLEHGAGVGARWVSPVGMVRVDAAWPLTEPGKPVRFHLTLGPDL
jgi:translocation and assembly module TamA